MAHYHFNPDDGAWGGLQNVTFQPAMMWQTLWEPVRKSVHYESFKPYVKKNWSLKKYTECIFTEYVTQAYESNVI